MRFEIRDTGDLRRLNRLLREQADGKQLRKDLTRTLRGVLNPVAREVRAAYRAAPSGGHGTATRARRSEPDLRGLLAKATKVEVRLSGRRAGARVRVDGRKMPSGMRALPAYWEGERGTTAGRGRWRHPVFGDRDTWVQQPSHPLFYAIADRHEPEAHRKAEAVLDEVRRKLEGR